MGSSINRVNNDFSFNYDRFTRNNINYQESIKNVGTINSSNNFKTFNGVETMEFDDDNVGIRSLIKELKEFSLASSQNAMTTTMTNSLENLSYKEYSQILESLDSEHLKTSDAALLFMNLDYCIDTSSFSAEEKSSLLQKLDFTWNNYADSNDDNTLKYIQESYINKWHSDRVSTLNLTGVDVDRAIQEITNDADDYDSSVLNVVASYSKEINGLSETSKNNIMELEALASKQVYR